MAVWVEGRPVRLTAMWWPVASRTPWSLSPMASPSESSSASVPRAWQAPNLRSSVKNMPPQLVSSHRWLSVSREMGLRVPSELFENIFGRCAYRQPKTAAT